MQQNLSIETQNFGNAAKFANRGTATIIMQVNLPIDTAIEMQQNLSIETLHYGDAATLANRDVALLECSNTCQ